MSFHKCHVNSASRSQTQIHTQLLTLASSVSRPSRVRGIRGPQGPGPAWSRPVRGPRLFFCAFYGGHRARGEGETRVCPPPPSGRRWPRHACGPVRVKELLSCRRPRLRSPEPSEDRAGGAARARAWETGLACGLRACLTRCRQGDFS